MILGRDLLTPLGLDLKFSEEIILGGDGPLKGCSSPMLDVNTYGYKPLIYNKVKPEESYINAYVDKCLESEGTISSTRIIRRLLDVKYEKADLCKSVDEKCQHLCPNEGEIILHILEKLRVCSMEHWVRGKPLR